EKADLRRKAAEPRGGHLLGYGDRGKRQAGNHVAWQIARPKGAQRTENRPASLGTVRAILRHRSSARAATLRLEKHSSIARQKASDAIRAVLSGKPTLQAPP